jgi:hypothetical protein
MKAVLVVLSEPSSNDREDEYNDWYDEVHLGEVCQIPGITGAKRYVRSSTQLDPSGSLGAERYLALYEIDSNDLATVARELNERAVDGRFTMNDALRFDPPPVTSLYELH